MLATKQTWKEGFLIAQIIILNEQTTLKVSFNTAGELSTIYMVGDCNGVIEPGHQNTTTNKQRQRSALIAESQYHGTVNLCTLPHCSVTNVI